MQKPEISQKAFWDVRFREIDFEKNSLHVMEKIFNYGTWDDQVAIMKFYGLNRIRKEIVKAAYLRKPVLSFLCAILHLKKLILHFISKCSRTHYPGTTKGDHHINQAGDIWIGWWHGSCFEIWTSSFSGP